MITIVDLLSVRSASANLITCCMSCCLTHFSHTGGSGAVRSNLDTRVAEPVTAIKVVCPAREREAAVGGDSGIVLRVEAEGKVLVSANDHLKALVVDDCEEPNIAIGIHHVVRETESRLS